MPVLAIGIICVGAGGSFWPLLAAAAAAEFGPQGVGRAFGLLSFFLPLAVLAPFVVAKTQENAGSYVPALVSISVVALVGGSACLLMRERRGGQDTPTRQSLPKEATLPIA